jgi:mannose-1-phosphate guanylyltransferase
LTNQGSRRTTPIAAQQHRLWSIVLAGGEGSRTRDFIERELGTSRPKQYCSFVGTRSLLQHTVDRADRISLPQHRVVIVAREHREEAQSHMAGRPPGVLLLQPENRGTAPGVFLPLTHVFARDPDATVVIYPSDHFVYPEAAFNRAITEGIALAEKLPGRLMLLGVTADGPETGYGWIQPGDPLPGAGRGRVHRVAYFIEKPTTQTAETLFHRGASWNTSIVIGRVKTLWGLGLRYIPQMMAPFVELLESLGTEPEETVVDRIYRDMPTLDFSRDLLQAASMHLAVMSLEGVLWSDWGSPQRILDTLALIGARPAGARERAARRRWQEGAPEYAVRA